MPVKGHAPVLLMPASHATTSEDHCVFGSCEPTVPCPPRMDSDWMGEQETAPAALDVPTGHRIGAVAPEVSTYEPAGAGVHGSLPVAL